MDLQKSVDDRGRLARTALAVALAALAVGSLRRGKRLVGALAGAGAVALGYSAASGSDTDAVGIPPGAETGSEPADGQLLCSVCGEPIVPGQRRSPDPHDETAHEDCLAA